MALGQLPQDIWMLRRYYDNHKNSHERRKKSEVVQTLVAGFGIPIAVLCLLWVMLHIV